ncbi:MAG: hypothetical protein QOI04_1565 [Verrucomicrobiota bacterium]|jgi:hypothetical protein
MPPPTNPDFLGYLKYEGALVADGVIDARAAADSLASFDSALRFFISEERQDLQPVRFPIPVRIEGQSWEAIIPHTLGQWFTVGLGIAVATYLKTAARKIAEKDFENIGFAELFAKALAGIQWFIKIGKHLGSVKQPPVTNLQWRNNNEEVGVPNAEGHVLFVPRVFYELFLEAPPKLLSGIVGPVEDERVLIVGRRQPDESVEEVTVTSKDKSIFYQATDESTEILFPELKHGQSVGLDGIVTRENGTANSLGFRYQDHILTCYPRTGSVVRYKEHLFLRCRIIGQIDRSDEHGGTSDPRPKIIFDDLKIIQDQSAGPPLL